MILTQITLQPQRHKGVSKRASIAYDVVSQVAVPSWSWRKGQPSALFWLVQLLRVDIREGVLEVQLFYGVDIYKSLET